MLTPLSNTGITGPTGHFCGFLAAFVNASFSFIGVETVVVVRLRFLSYSCVTRADLTLAHRPPARPRTRTARSPRPPAASLHASASSTSSERSSSA